MDPAWSRLTAAIRAVSLRTEPVRSLDERMGDSQSSQPRACNSFAFVDIRMERTINMRTRKTIFVISALAQEGGSMKFDLTPGGGSRAGIFDSGTPGGIEFIFQVVAFCVSRLLIFI